MGSKKLNACVSMKALSLSLSPYFVLSLSFSLYLQSSGLYYIKAHTIRISYFVTHESWKSIEKRDEPNESDVMYAAVHHLNQLWKQKFVCIAIIFDGFYCSIKLLNKFCHLSLSLLLSLLLLLLILFVVICNHYLLFVTFPPRFLVHLKNTEFNYFEFKRKIFFYFNFGLRLRSSWEYNKL